LRANLLATQERSAKNLDEFRANLLATQERSDKHLDEFRANMLATQERSAKQADADRKEMRRRFGRLCNSLGLVIEEVLLPGLKSKMNELGHHFTMSSPRKIFDRPDGSSLAEVDSFLENREEVMVVEVKTEFLAENAMRLLERLKTLRENEEITGLVGKTMYAAAAGISFVGDARRIITENGIYMVDIDDDNDRIKVTPPEKGKEGKW